MARPKSKRPTRSDPTPSDAFALRPAGAADPERESQVHRYGEEDRVVCDTDKIGHKTPEGRSPLEIVVDTTEGFVPLWAKNTTLRWRFRERSMTAFRNPAAAKSAIRTIFGRALLEWGNAAPVKFAERNDLWDFEFVMRRSDDCDDSGCVLASAFFPDGGRHSLTLYPQMFAQTAKEQVETLVHEIGHVFGLRHFFANISETEWSSETFGTHSPFTIMNYGNKSRLTAADKADLTRLYQGAWSGELTDVNGTPIRLVKNYSAGARDRAFEPVDALAAMALALVDETRPAARVTASRRRRTARKR